MAHLVGTSGNDSLVGTSAADTIDGLAGNDTLIGLAGNDRLNGGAGDDRYVVATGDLLSDTGGVDTVESSTTWSLGAAFENLILTGTGVTSGSGNELNNVITGSAGNNWLRGRGGNDTIFGGGGNDTFNMSLGAGGLYGNDVIDGGTGVDTLDFGAAALTAVVINLGAGTASGGGAGGAGTISLTNVENANGGAYNDIITGTAGANFLFGFHGDDTLSGAEGNDRLEGGEGNDRILGGLGADTLIGGAGNDSLDAGDFVGFDFQSFNDSVSGGDGDDTLRAGFGDNTMDGGLGNDVYEVWSESDVLIEAGGIDSIVTVDISWTLGDGFENLSTRRSEQGVGGAHSLFGNNLNNVIDGRHAGDGRLEGRGGDDTVYGSDDGYNQVLDGGDGNDVLEAGFGSDTVIGGTGNDVLTSRGGWARLDGGAGNDTLAGGGDTHDHIFSAAPGAANADVIIGFSTGADRIVLDATVHLNLGPNGKFGASDARFVAGEGITSGADSSDRVVYNTTTGQLFYDADGSGSGAAQLIATLDGAPVLAASDIVAQNSSAGFAITGTSGNDSIAGTPADESISGLAGNDTIRGGGGSDSLFGGDGNDQIAGGDEDPWPDEGAGSDLLVGGLGDDTLDGRGNGIFTDDNVDTMDGGLGDDIYYVDHPDDVLVDAGGIDTVRTELEWTLAAGFENLFAFPIEGAVSVVGNELDNRLGAGDDCFVYGRAGNDTIHGWDSTLYGEAGDDVLGADLGHMHGGEGNDTLTGFGSNMNGGAGADHFAPTGAGVVIEDFVPSLDTVRIDGEIFAGAGPSGRLTAGDERFYSAAGATAAHDSTDRLIYNTSTGQLFYDRDGTGSAPAQLLALVQGAPGLAAADIEVVNGDGAVINGTEGNDSLTGTPAADIINGFGGNDTLWGHDGNDLLSGGAGNDSLIGGTFGLTSADRDTLDGGAGDDIFDIRSIHGTRSDLTLVDSGGHDTVLATNWGLGAGFEDLTLDGNYVDRGTGVGNELNNVIRVVSFTGQLFNIQGREGDDTLIGGAGSELVFGGDGNDWIETGDHAMENDEAAAGAGQDSFVFRRPTPDSAFADLIHDFAPSLDRLVLDNNGFSALGGAGNFTTGDARFFAGAGATSGQDASHRVVYNTSTGDVYYDADGSGPGAAVAFAKLAGALVLSATDIAVIGNAGAAVITGTSAAETLTGSAGNDRISGLAGSDRIFGRDGNDSLLGGTEADNMFGENGNDWLDGDAGQDRVTGGAGADSFVYNDPLASANADYINDFISGTDKILLDNAVMTALGPDGALASGRFVAAANARSGLDADDRLMYDTVSGKLYYDADGSGAGAQSVIAVLTGAPTLTASDIVVI